ncbi:polyphosphate kinase [Candidatus Bathyarchaeota archaeon RBG_13_38_9]|nr:MAG: polyphosphate kinase [Candidatus Bathyarchaeota archaeon RBG_13_38_9]
MKKQIIIPPFGKNVNLKDYDTRYAGPNKDKNQVREETIENLKRLRVLQEMFYAEGKRSLLIVLQATDTGGKDGTIRHVFRGVNPQGVQVTSFKQPSVEELSHDFLWRIHQHTPPKGYIGVFNRSHYEDVLIVRVENIVPKNVWNKRYQIINDFEESLVENETAILKFFLHISKEEQKQRLEARRDDPKKQWKFSVDDVKKRALWDDYVKAYEDVLTKCNTKYAPWHIVPADNKWYRNFIISNIIANKLEELDPKLPKPEKDIEKIVVPY